MSYHSVSTTPDKKETAQLAAKKYFFNKSDWQLEMRNDSPENQVVATIIEKQNAANIVIELVEIGTRMETRGCNAACKE